MSLPRFLALATAAIGVIAWAVHFQSGLVLSHYDAKAHLVVARRVFDNLTPGWQPYGADLLPARDEVVEHAARNDEVGACVPVAEGQSRPRVVHRGQGARDENRERDQRGTGGGEPAASSRSLDSGARRLRADIQRT